MNKFTYQSITLVLDYPKIKKLHLVKPTLKGYFFLQLFRLSKISLQLKQKKNKQKCIESVLKVY